MSYQSKQIQSFNGEELIELKQGVGRFNMFTKLSALIEYFREQLGISSSTETITVSVQEEVYASVGTSIPATDNGVLGITVAIAAVDASGNTTSLASAPQQNFNNISLDYNDVFAEFTYNLSEIPEDTVNLLVYIVVINTVDGSQHTYIAKANYGKGNQLINIFIKKVEV